MPDQITTMLMEIASSTHTLDDYIAATIAAGLRGDPGYDLATLEDVAAAAPQYDTHLLMTRAPEIERADRNRRNEIAKAAADRAGPSQFAAPRWVPDPDKD